MTTDPTPTDRVASPAGDAATRAQSDEARQRQIRRGRLKMLAILLVCAAPVIASYFTYYVIRPEGRTNYGTLLDPLREVAGFVGTGLDGAPAGLAQMKGRWVLVTGGNADCDAGCENRLFLMRQVRLTAGKDRDRVERAWIVAPDADPSAKLLAEHEGMIVIRADPGAMAAAGFIAAEGARPQDHIWVVDPLGNLVLRYPVAADPSRMKKDLLKLLKASRIG